jgi:hypothetical protein
LAEIHRSKLWVEFQKADSSMDWQDGSERDDLDASRRRQQASQRLDRQRILRMAGTAFPESTIPKAVTNSVEAGPDPAD